MSEAISPGAKDDSPAGAKPAGIVHPQRPALFATLLTAISGFLDAVGYVQLNKLYVSFMSGNSTHLGTAIGTGAWGDALQVVAIVGLFVLGASIGTAIADRRPPVLPVLGGEVLLFIVAITLARAGHDWPALALIALAMGLQNTLHQVVSGADIGKGFLTGALFSLGQSIARVFRDRSELAKGAQNGLSWIAFVGGAALGTITLASIGLTAALTVMALVLLAMIAGVKLAWL